MAIPSLALAVKPDNPGGSKFDAEAAIQAETDARIAADADLQNQINDNVLYISDNAANIQANTDAINAFSGGLKVYDNNNQYIGYYLGGVTSEFDMAFYRADIDAYFRMTGDDLRNVNNNYFATEDCSGTVYGGGLNYFTNSITRSGNRYFKFDTTTVVSEITRSRLTSSGDCLVLSPLVRNLYLGTEIQMPFQTPVALPFRIVP